MRKRGKNKSKIIDYDSDVEVAKVTLIPRVEIIYEDTKEVNGALLVEKKVPEAGLDDLALYDNVLRSGITKVTTRLEIFPCA